MSGSSFTKTSINAEGAQKVLAAGVARALELAAPATVAVVDASGTLTALLRMDGSPHIGAELARRKAFTAITMGGVDTGKVAQRLDSNPALAAALSALPGVALLPGAVPLRLDGEVVGAVGVSASVTASDAPIAEAAADALTEG